jgi:hypothetical protein|tara:strand:- start:700 stop:1563 length:864 start_codon:yes stop_codon:yes gene_type:complete
MKRVIYSLYIDVPKEELDVFDKNILKPNVVPTNYKTKSEFKKHYDDLIACKQAYAMSINVDFKMFEFDLHYVNYQKQMQAKYPYLTTYNVINFYKIHLLYELAKVYDEIVYLDFDVVPMKYDNFFTHWDLSKGIAVLNNNDRITPIENVSDTSQTIRSPSSKHFNAQAMLFEKGMSTENDVINTGIIGINKDHLNKLAYFENFDENLKMMTDLTKESDIFPDKVRQYFGWDNETLFAVKLKENKVPVQWLDDKWHYFFAFQGFIPNDTILCHVICKDFDLVWRKINA